MCTRQYQADSGAYSENSERTTSQRKGLQWNGGSDRSKRCWHLRSTAGRDRANIWYFGGASKYMTCKERPMVYELLTDEDDVHVAYGTVTKNGMRQAGKGMPSSRFYLKWRDTRPSNHLFDAIVSYCVPVIISHEIELFFEDVLKNSKFVIFVQALDATRDGFLLNLLRGIDRYEWAQM